MFGGGFPTNNDLVNITASIVGDEGAQLLCLSGGTGRGPIQHTMGRRPLNYK